MKKIMFNDRYGLTQAVIDGRKTQTRRLASKQNFTKPFGNFCKGKLYINEMFKDGEISKYAVEEVVAVAQCYSKIMDYYNSLGHVSKRNVSEQELIFWNAMRTMESNGHDSAMQGDENKMFVKADLMPFRIRITNIRIEHLQDISEQDCMAEGVRRWGEEKEYLSNDTVRKSVDELKAAGYDAYAIPGCWNCYTSPRKAYADLIDKVSGKGTWEKNPWVFVYDFELVK